MSDLTYGVRAMHYGRIADAIDFFAWAEVDLKDVYWVSFRTIRALMNE